MYQAISCACYYCPTNTFPIGQIARSKVKRESPSIIALAFMFDLKFCVHFVGASGKKVMADKLSENISVVSIEQLENLKILKDKKRK